MLHALAIAEYNAGKLEDARRDFEEVATAKGHDLGFGRWSATYLAATENKLGRPAEAEKWARQALDGYAAAAETGAWEISTHRELGLALAAQGRNAEAEAGIGALSSAPAGGNARSPAGAHPRQARRAGGAAALRAARGQATPMKLEVTEVLRMWNRGETQALDELMVHLLGDLRQLAGAYLRRERPDHTLQPTALVNELYLRLAEREEVDWQNRAHFFAFAATQMRRILVDHARHHRAGETWAAT